ncbi:hypothetical protein NIES267_74740 (plasmid) [Calothrix parasitica NIES-267]|uniref:Fertility inhibition FinO-like protein n=1 Tax=Calothrix parasitica NIES-267 TaxID=1973488 RepID=A0A1Z4M391_9CYAN|nr:hypothetical protein NIES267_74740 [Calothrix parasitica NIES-267]
MEAKSEVTIKFTGGLPQANPAPNKKVEVNITDQNGVNFSVLLNAKSWRKAESNAQAFTDWVGAISGKLGQASDGGFTIEGAGVQIFERKPKEQKEPQAVASN